MRLVCYLRYEQKTTCGVLIALLIYFTLFSVCMPAYAVEPESPETNSASVIEPEADVIEFKYRVNNGVYQYRRWNETRGYWYDRYVRLWHN